PQGAHRRTAPAVEGCGEEAAHRHAARRRREHRRLARGRRGGGLGEGRMPYDLLIKYGSVVDGTGASARRADVAVADGKVVEIGKVGGRAEQTIDASDLVVAPGFVDPHTHYDAQICWDGAVTPSSWHGVTTVVMGNCGVGI